jgi:Protein of unknown function (DUF2490)
MKALALFAFGGLWAMLLLQSSVAAQTSPPQTDTQQWNDVQIAVPVTKDIDFNILGTVRVGRNVSRPVDERIGVGATFRLGQYFTIAPSYVHIGTQPFPGRKVWEDRFSFPVTVRFQAGKFRLSDRNLFERRWRSPSVDATRYRNRVQVEYPVGPDRMKWSLFVSDEVFYDWSVNDWVRNRFMIGIIRPLNKNITLDVYYLRQNDGRSIPGDLHVIGTTWRIKL